MKIRMHQIPQLSFTKELYDKIKNEIKLNLNDFLWLHQTIEDYRISHLRLLPTIHVKSPSGKISYFADPIHEGTDLVYKNKHKTKLRLTFF